MKNPLLFNHFIDSLLEDDVQFVEYIDTQNKNYCLLKITFTTTTLSRPALRSTQPPIQ
jgi:hypothetical protein